MENFPDFASNSRNNFYFFKSSLKSCTNYFKNSPTPSKFAKNITVFSNSTHSLINTYFRIFSKFHKICKNSLENAYDAFKISDNF